MLLYHALCAVSAVLVRVAANPLSSKQRPATPSLSATHRVRDMATGGLEEDSDFGTNDCSWNGPSRCTVDYPTSEDWFTEGTLSVIDWDCDQEDYDASFRAELSNANKFLLAAPIVLADSLPASWLGFGTELPLIGARPGKGYVVTIYDHSNTSYIWAESEKFELRASGSQAANLPEGYGAALKQLSQQGTSTSAARSVQAAKLALVAGFVAGLVFM